MSECRFYPWCSYMIEHGCTKGSCPHHRPMPDVAALLEIAEQFDGSTLSDSSSPGTESWMCLQGANESLRVYRKEIREALGEARDGD